MANITLMKEIALSISININNHTKKIHLIFNVAESTHVHLFNLWRNWFQSCHHILFNHSLHCSLYCMWFWMTRKRSCAQHVQLYSPNAQVTFRCNLCGKRDEVTIVTCYLQWDRGDPGALLLPLSHLDPESRREDNVRYRLLWAATQCYSKSSNHSCLIALSVAFACMCVCPYV